MTYNSYNHEKKKGGIVKMNNREISHFLDVNITIKHNQNMV
jgi:hypothetical protein